MFTGIVEDKGVVRSLARRKGRIVLEIENPGVASRIKIGGSLAVNGVCLTVVKKTKKSIFFNLVRETAVRSTLASLRARDRVNLERPLKMGARIEGHFVLGHVDGIGKVHRVMDHGGEKSFLIRFPRYLKPLIVEKGSVGVDGVSLTVGKVHRDTFWIHCIPHTLKKTRLGEYRVHETVNLEADILAKFALEKPRRIR